MVAVIIKVMVTMICEVDLFWRQECSIRVSSLRKSRAELLSHHWNEGAPYAGALRLDVTRCQVQ